MIFTEITYALTLTIILFLWVCAVLWLLRLESKKRTCLTISKVIDILMDALQFAAVVTALGFLFASCFV